MSMNFRFGSSVPVPVTVAVGSRGAIGRFGTARIRFVLMTISVGSPRVMDIVPTRFLKERLVRQVLPVAEHRD